MGEGVGGDHRHALHFRLAAALVGLSQPLGGESLRLRRQPRARPAVTVDLQRRPAPDHVGICHRQGTLLLCPRAAGVETEQKHLHPVDPPLQFRRILLPERQRGRGACRSEAPRLLAGAQSPLAARRRNGWLRGDYRFLRPHIPQTGADHARRGRIYAPWRGFPVHQVAELRFQPQAAEDAGRRSRGCG